MAKKIGNLASIGAFALVVVACGGTDVNTPAGSAHSAGSAGAVDVAGSGGGTTSGDSAGFAGSADPGGSTAASQPEPLGEAGSHVWLSSSVAIEVYSFMSCDPLFDPAAQSSSSCWSLKRETMSDAQRAFLENVVLVPLVPNCTPDCTSFRELTVIDSDGTRAQYRDKGGSGCALPGAQGMLASGWSAGLGEDGKTACAQ